MAQLVKLLNHQAQFLQAPYLLNDIRFFILCGGFACGKTSSLVYVVNFAVKCLLGKKDKEGHNPRIMVGSKNITFLAKTWTDAFEQNLKMTGSNYHFDRAKNIITIGNVEIILVATEEPTNIYGYSVSVAVIDELDELPTNIAMEAVKSVNDRVRQQIEGFRDPFICFATTSQGLKGLYQTVMHFKKSGIGYFLLRARTRDNTYLPVEYVKNMYSIYNEKEVRCLLEGEFISIDSGLVFPDYNPAVNKLDEDLFDCLEDNDVVYIGQDFNSFGNHAVAFVVKKFDDGTSAIVAIKDYKLPDMRRAPEVFRYDFPTQKIVWIPDMTYKEHFIEFKKELRAFNITIAYRSCNPLVNDRVFACNKLFHAERLFICPICKDLETALLTHQRDPKTGMPMKGGETAPDHKSDCLGYAVHYLLSWNRDLKELYDVTLRYMYSKRKARGADSAELEPEDSLISADKIKAIPLKKANNVDKNNFNK